MTVVATPKPLPMPFEAERLNRVGVFATSAIAGVVAGTSARIIGTVKKPTQKIGGGSFSLLLKRHGRCFKNKKGTVLTQDFP